MMVPIGTGRTEKILLIDNYDSFTYNLKQLFAMNYQGQIVTIRNDSIRLFLAIFSQLVFREFEAIVISPGPGSPKDARLSNLFIRLFSGSVPILGVCLGMQCINEVFGGKTVRAPYPVHGKRSVIGHECSILFRSLPHEFHVARYHSLMVAHIPSCLMVTSRTKDGIPMAIEHERFRCYGVQFHPESFMTEHGGALIRNFLSQIKKRGNP